MNQLSDCSMVSGICQWGWFTVSQGGETVLRGGSVVVALECCKPSHQNQVSNWMTTTILFLLGILVGLAYAEYLKHQLRK